MSVQVFAGVVEQTKIVMREQVLSYLYDELMQICEDKLADDDAKHLEKCVDDASCSSESTCEVIEDIVEIEVRTKEELVSEINSLLSQISKDPNVIPTHKKLAELSGKELVGVMARCGEPLILKHYQRVGLKQICAMLLDPRLNLAYCHTNKWEKQIDLEVIPALESEINSFDRDDVPEVHLNKKDSKQLEDMELGDLPGHMKAQFKNEGSRQVETSCEELNEYLNRGRMRVPQPLHYWHDRTNTHPNVSCLALNVLCIPPTSACIERLFSDASMQVTKRRTQLSDTSLESILMLRTLGWLDDPNFLSYYNTYETSKVLQKTEDNVQIIQGKRKRSPTKSSNADISEYQNDLRFNSVEQVDNYSSVCMDEVATVNQNIEGLTAEKVEKQITEQKIILEDNLKTHLLLSNTDYTDFEEIEEYIKEYERTKSGEVPLMKNFWMDPYLRDRARGLGIVVTGEVTSLWQGEKQNHHRHATAQRIINSVVLKKLAILVFNLNGNHWACIIFEKQDKNTESNSCKEKWIMWLLDSLDDKKGLLETYANELSAAAPQLQFNVIRPSISQQRDNHSCGYRVLSFWSCAVQQVIDCKTPLTTKFWFHVSSTFRVKHTSKDLYFFCQKKMQNKIS